jgi:Mpp10 protein
MPSNEKSPALSSTDILDVLKSVDEQISNPGAFCTTSTANAASLCLLMTKLFKVSAHSTNKTFGPFDELLVEGFDGETIWEELQTRNRPLTRFLQKKINVIHGRVQKVINSKQAAKSARRGKLTGKQLVDSTEPNREVDEIADDDAEGSSIEDRLSASDMQDSDDEDDRDGDDNDDEEEEEEEEENGSIDEDINLEILDDEDFDDEYSGGGDAEYDDIDNMQAWLDKQEEMEEKHEKKLERLQKLAAQKGAVEEVGMNQLIE